MTEIVSHEHHLKIGNFKICHRCRDAVDHRWLFSLDENVYTFQHIDQVLSPIQLLQTSDLFNELDYSRHRLACVTSVNHQTT